MSDASGSRSEFDLVARAYGVLMRAVAGETGVRVGIEGDLTWALAPLPLAVFNRVIGVRLTTDDADRRIDETIANFTAVGARHSWWLDPYATPTGLGARLEALGYLRDEQPTPGMAIDLDYLPALELPSGASARFVTDEDGMRDSMMIAGAGFGMPDELLSPLMGLLAPVVHGATESIRIAVLSLDARPAATALVATQGELAGIYSVATVPESRGRGLGRAATLAVLHDARDRGASTAVLESTEMGYPVYRGIGFRDLGDFRVYVR